MLSDDYREALAALEAVIHGPPAFRLEAADIRPLAMGMRALMLMAGTGLGECRLETPYSPLRPVIDAHGAFKWCCNHNPEHCAS